MLVEQSLLTCQRATWLERTEIDRVLKEQQLTALLSPESCRQRSTIGRLLKADLLVLLRHFEKPKPYVQLVVCETSRGLRLAVHQAPLSDDVEADAAVLTQLAEQAIARHDRPIDEICAVPPFVSHDLTYENDYRKAAYARLVEQTIADRPGLLTVELEEARAIADEAGLSGEQVQRNLPLYLLGDYRHEGKGEGQTATLRVLVQRGQQVLDKRFVVNTPIDQSASFIRNATAELIDQTSGVLPSRPNPKVEAEQLAQRAETFHQLGGWDEAASLAEASLMLDPGQKRMHEVAASSLAYLARRDAQYRNGPDVVARGIHFYFRALEHYESLLPADEPRRQRRHRAIARAPVDGGPLGRTS